MPQVGSASKAEQWVDEWLYVTDSELAQCEAVSPIKESCLIESDVNLALEKGESELFEHLIKERDLLSDHVIEMIGRVLWVYFSPIDIKELVVEVLKLRDLGHNCSACSLLSQQLSDWFNKLETDYTSSAFASAVATSLSALADCLYDKGVISEEDFHQVQNVCWRFTTNTEQYQ